MESKRARIPGDFAVFDYSGKNHTTQIRPPIGDSNLGYLGMCGLVAKDCVDKSRKHSDLKAPHATGAREAVFSNGAIKGCFLLFENLPSQMG